MNYCVFMFLGPLILITSSASAQRVSPIEQYRQSIQLLHYDYHAKRSDSVGRDLTTDSLTKWLSDLKPGLVQIHAKGGPGITTFPSKVGYRPTVLVKDVQAEFRDAARKTGTGFWIYANLGRDAEVLTHHPEWNRRKADGTLYDNMICYHTGIQEQYHLPLISELIDRYQPDGFWFDGTTFTVNNCYCDACTARFKRETGLVPPKTPQEPGWVAFKEMHRQIYRAFIAQTYQHVKQKAPNCVVAVNVAYSLNMPEQPKNVDVLTFDFNNEVHRIPTAAHWYDAQGLPFDIMTTVYFREDGKGVFPKPQGQIEQEMAIILANGGRYFAWDNPTPTTAINRERTVFQQTTIRPFLNARKPFCLGSKRVPQVSVLYSAANHYAKSIRQVNEFPRNDEIMPLADSLLHLHIDYEFVNDTHLMKGQLNTRHLLVYHADNLPDSLERAIALLKQSGTQVLRISNNQPARLAQLSNFVPVQDRLLLTNAPPTVEAIVRKQAGRTIVHLVNRHPGISRKTTKPGPALPHYEITNIPPVKSHLVRLRMAKRPQQIRLQPQNQSFKAWTYIKGMVNINVPEYAIHQLIVVE